MTSPDLHGTTTKMATWLLRRKKHSNRQKKSPSHKLGLSSLNAVITVRHLLREEKQGMKALRRIIQVEL